MTKFRNPEQPLYFLVRENMLKRLGEGEWGPGERIPTEPELAKIFSVSVGTVRKAIEDLVTEKILVRRARIGTTVALHQEHNQFSTFFNFQSKSGDPLKVSAQLLSFGKTKATKELANIFKLPEKESLIVIDNLRLINNEPAMYDRIWLPEKHFPQMDRKVFEGRPDSIYALFQRQFKITVLRIYEQIEAINPPDFVQQELKLKKTDASLKISRHAMTYGDEVIEYRHRYVNTSLCRYQNQIGLKE